MSIGLFATSCQSPARVFPVCPDLRVPLRVVNPHQGVRWPAGGVESFFEEEGLIVGIVREPTNTGVVALSSHSLETRWSYFDPHWTNIIPSHRCRDGIAIGCDNLKTENPRAQTVVLNSKTGVPVRVVCARNMAWHYTQIGDVMLGHVGDCAWFENWNDLHGNYFRLEAVSAETGELLWAIHNGELGGSTRLACDGEVFVTSDYKRGVAICAELRTGRTLWEHRSLPRLPETTPTDGILHGVTYSMQPAIWKGLAILNWYVAIEAVDLKTGTQIWFLPMRDFRWSSSATLADDRVFAAGDREYLVLDPRTGEILFRRDMQSEFDKWGLKPFYIGGNHLAVAKDFVYFPRANKLICMDRHTGEIVAAYKFAAEGIIAEPFWVHDRLVIHSGTAMTVFEHNPRGRLTKPRKTLITK